MRAGSSKRWLLAPGLLFGLAVLLVGEAALAFRGEGSPEAPGSPNEVVGPPDGAPLALAVLGDSTGSGVGAVTQDLGYPRRVARAVADRHDRRVHLNVLAVSGARVNDVLTDQLPRLEGRPDVILLVIGGNDVINLTAPGRARADLDAVLTALGRRGVPVIVSGIPAMGTITRVLQPLRAVTGIIAAAIYDPIWRDETSRHRMLRVELAALTGPQFSRDHSLMAPDGFHPGPRGYAAWAEAFIPAVERAAGLTPTGR
ncbi:MAG: SGNH/GDSL hydrolase family protein [Candidatus Dormibacteria bacterium]